MTDDAREFVRVSRSLEFEVETAGGAETARVQDLGEGGAFVDTMNPFGVGEQFHFKLNLDDGKEPIVGVAVVKWQQSSVGMGVAFTEISDDDRERIKYYVAAEFFKTFTPE